MPAFPAYPNQGRRIREYPLAAAQTFLQGAAVLLDANGATIGAGADPPVILGFALFDAGNLPYVGSMLVAIAHPRSTFIMMGTSAPVQADVGVDYGIVEDVDGIWVVDKTDVVNTRVMVERIFTEFGRAQFEVNVLPANRQFG